MHFASSLITGTFLRRYKRFFVDVEDAAGRTITVHCANTGTMRGCSTPGMPAAFSLHGRSDRRLPGTLELVRDGEQWVGVKPVLANTLVSEAVACGAIARWCGYLPVRTEVRGAAGKSRFDLLLEHPEEGELLVEIKSVSWVEAGEGRFPDARSDRARRHADDLAALSRNGRRTAIVFCVQRGDARCVRPAWEVDRAYGDALRRAHDAGVVLAAFSCNVSLDGVKLARELPFDLGL